VVNATENIPVSTLVVSCGVEVAEEEWAFRERESDSVEVDMF
jgi:hypothetical protein